MRTWPLIALAALLICSLAPAQPAEPSPKSEPEKIRALIRGIETLKGAQFIRNGKEYDAKTAAKFLRGKWQANEKQIKTAADFIKKAATLSSTTGKPYLIRFPDGREIKCGEFLKAELKKLEPPPAQNSP